MGKHEKQCKRRVVIFYCMVTPTQNMSCKLGNLGIAVHACYLSTWKVEPGGSGIQGQCQVYENMPQKREENTKHSHPPISCVLDMVANTYTLLMWEIEAGRIRSSRLFLFS